MMTTSTLDLKPTSTESAVKAGNNANITNNGNDSHSIFPADLPPAPLLENVVAAICLDARRDSLRYALRSNVGHDGE